MKAWKIHKLITGKTPANRRQNIITALLNSRGLTQKKAIAAFLNPHHPENLTPKTVGITTAQTTKTLKRIQTAIDQKQPIIIYGDYDADGICATAILWETLYKLTPHVTPFIPHRQKHGYGLSIKGIKDIIENPNHYSLATKPSLIITVDNGIVAHHPVEYATAHGMEVIITDHHVPGKTLPQAQAIFHTTQLAGSGVAWLLSQVIAQKWGLQPMDNIEIAAIGSVADMVPLIGANRSIVKHGLQQLAHTQRVGLKAIFSQAGIEEGKSVGTYDINFVIAPRLNAMGRIGHALDSLRLLCTKNPTKAQELAASLGDMNRDRQQLTEDQLLHAKEIVGEITTQKILIVSHTDYHEGVIGLVAGKLVETYWRPTIVLSVSGDTAKASARSIPGFNMIEALREMSHHLIDVGGHPMAAGFTIETAKIAGFTQELQQLAQKTITDDLLERSLKIDCEISLSDISWELYEKLEQFEPFGVGNPRPVFATKDVEIVEARGVGQDKKHLKLAVKVADKTISGIGFNQGAAGAHLTTGDHIDIVYTLDKNEWNNHTELQLKIIDVGN